MRRFIKPRVVISRCIEFEPVRWDGQMISSDFVKKLIPHVDPITVCPEVEIGLGVPRDPVRIVQAGGRLRLMQPATNRDLTEKMREFIDSFLDSVGEIDGFILKSRSPTSGLKDVKVYDSNEKGPSIGRGLGFLGRAVLERHPDLAIEDERRLTNPRIREHFLTKLFAIANLRERKASNSMKRLVEFHTEYKLLLRAYNQKELEVLGRIVANPVKKPLAQAIRDYEHHFSKALNRPPRCGSNINVLMHAFGYFSKKLSKDEGKFFLDSLDKYRQGRLPLSVSLGIIRSWTIRFQEEYLEKQTFFEPYPEELMGAEAMSAPCDTKDYWEFDSIHEPD